MASIRYEIINGETVSILENNTKLSDSLSLNLFINTLKKCTTTKIMLSERDIGDSELIQLVSVLVKKIKGDLTNTRPLNLAQIHLQNNNIGSKGLDSLKELFRTPSEINYINLAFNKIKFLEAADFLTKIKEYIRANKSTQRIRINLSNNPISDQEYVQLKNLVTKSPIDVITSAELKVTHQTIKIGPPVPKTASLKPLTIPPATASISSPAPIRILEKNVPSIPAKPKTKISKAQADAILKMFKVKDEAHKAGDLGGIKRSESYTAGQPHGMKSKPLSKSPSLNLFNKQNVFMNENTFRPLDDSEWVLISPKR